MIKQTTSNIDPVNETDLGNALRLVERHGQDIRYVAQWKTWLTWNGQFWTIDHKGDIYEKAKDTALSIYDEAERKHRGDIFRYQELREHAKSSESKSRIEAMVKLAQSDPRVVVEPVELDRDPWLFNVENGTVDLRTDQLRGHCQEDLITKVAPVSYDPTAKCPLWDQFLDTITDGNEELITFLQRAIGYSAIGLSNEQHLFFLYGAGANGKSTFIELIAEILGEYAQKAPASMLKKKRGSWIPSEVARLKGARFVTACELSEGMELDEGWS